MKNINNIRKRLIVSIIGAIIGFIVLFISINNIRLNVAVKRQEKYSQAKLYNTQTLLQTSFNDSESDWDTYDSFVKAKVDMVTYLLGYNASNINDLANIAKQWELDNLYIIDSKGNIQYQSGKHLDNLAQGNLDRFIDYINGSDNHDYKTVDGYCYYISKSNNGYYVIGGKESSEMISLQDSKRDISTTLKDITVGYNGYICAIDTVDNTIVYDQDDSNIGLNVSDVFNKQLNTIKDGLVLRNNESYYCNTSSITIDDNNYLLAALVSEKELLNSSNWVLYCCLLVYTVTVVLVITYSTMLRYDMSKSEIAVNVKYKHLYKNYFINYSMFKRLATLGFISIIIIFVLSLFLQQLGNISRQKDLSLVRLNDVNTALDNDTNRSSELESMYENEYIQRANNIAYILDYDNTLLNDDSLETIADILNLPCINVYDESGNIVYTNTYYKDNVLSDDINNSKYNLWNVIKGYSNKEVVNVDNNIDNIIKYIGVSRLDDKGMVEIGLSSDILQKQLANTGLVHVLSNLGQENNSFIFALDNSDNTIAYANNINKIRLEYTAIGLNENSLNDSYVGWQNIEGINSFIVSQRNNNYTIYNGVINSSINTGSIKLSCITSIVSFILLTFIIVLSCLSEKQEMLDSIKNSRKTKTKQSYYTVVSADGSLMDKQAVDSRWSNTYIGFNKKNAGGKLATIVYYLLAVICIIFCFIYYLGLISDNNILMFIESKQWDKNINLFSISYALITGIQVFVIACILKQIISIISKPFNARVNTFMRLLDSFIKYGSALYILFNTLYCFGIDTKTLLASAGILTLIVGLGANSLIADVIAGIFIVFEGDFRVGDIVTIDDWRGTVEEIGIRTTKILSDGKDIKIIRNSSIGSVINMTRQYSLAYVDIQVNQDQDLKEFETSLKEQFKIIRKHIPEIVDGPSYQGLVSYDDGNGVIRINVLCKEKDRDIVTNKLNKEFKLLFDQQNNIHE